MSEFEKKYLESAQRRFAEHIEKTPEYVVQQIHRDDDIVKLWRCGKPQSSTYMFYICSAPNCLMVYGDMGEYMWQYMRQRHYDMLPFIRGAIGSLSYFSEKVPNGIKIKDDQPELVEEWFATVKQERIDYGEEWTDKKEEALSELRDTWSCNEDVTQFKWALYDSDLYNDYEDVPRTEFYTFHYLWTIEGLKWFIKQLDEGKVLPYVEQEKEAKTDDT
jgi:hypothetical protein